MSGYKHRGHYGVIEDDEAMDWGGPGITYCTLCEATYGSLKWEENVGLCILRGELRDAAAALAVVANHTDGSVKKFAAKAFRQALEAAK